MHVCEDEDRDEVICWVGLWTLKGIEGELRVLGFLECCALLCLDPSTVLLRGGQRWERGWLPRADTSTSRCSRSYGPRGTLPYLPHR
jgi:hypothetical protein